MAGLLEDVKELFGTDNLYEVLGCEKNSTRAEIKKAFYKCSLKYHPDRHTKENKKLATKKFQVLSKAFSILSDTETRAAYDETGIVGESFSERTFKDWVDYFNLIFPKFTTEDYEKHKKKYIGSEEEKNDIAKFYNRFCGDMDMIMECVMFADVFDEGRYRTIIQGLIDDKTVEPYDAFVNEPAKKRASRLKRTQKERREFERDSKKRKASGKEESSMDSLILAIQANREAQMKAMDNLVDNLATKYCQPRKRRQKSTRGKE